MEATYDCALLEPEAFPPDFPPVILIDLGWVLKTVCFGYKKSTGLDDESRYEVVVEWVVGVDR